MWESISELCKVVLMFNGRKCLGLFRMPIVLDILFATFCICVFQFKFSFIIRPRTLKSVTLSISIPSIYNDSFFILFCGLWKIIYLVFFIFNDYLLTFNHSLLLSNSLFIFPSADEIVLKALRTLIYVVSSA